VGTFLRHSVESLVRRLDNLLSQEMCFHYRKESRKTLKLGRSTEHLKCGQ